MLSGSYHKAPKTHPNGAGNSDLLKLNMGNGLVVGDSGCPGIALLACVASKEVAADSQKTDGRRDGWPEYSFPPSHTETEETRFQISGS